MLFCESANVVHISTRNCVGGPSSGSLVTAMEIRDAVEARELSEGAEDFVEAVEGRADLADVLPGIFRFQSLACHQDQACTSTALLDIVLGVRSI